MTLYVHTYENGRIRSLTYGDSSIVEPGIPNSIVSMEHLVIYSFPRSLEAM